ncbi:hypothetical protein B0H16DRAFT_1456708 [Mycena metata]|uniref:Uncharacterized protein n=1 Tax=Mycena metata TaxID=1033252 RepID=A0AAD7JCY0_9AGAR|nr:hypothetical protein B0H16DRAFT_1456708 [Mycena metata]
MNIIAEDLVKPEGLKDYGMDGMGHGAMLYSRELHSWTYVWFKALLMGGIDVRRLRDPLGIGASERAYEPSINYAKKKKILNRTDNVEPEPDYLRPKSTTQGTIRRVLGHQNDEINVPQAKYNNGKLEGRDTEMPEIEIFGGIGGWNTRMGYVSINRRKSESSLCGGAMLKHTSESGFQEVRFIDERSRGEVEPENLGRRDRHKASSKGGGKETKCCRRRENVRVRGNDEGRERERRRTNIRRKGSCRSSK